MLLSARQTAIQIFGIAPDDEKAIQNKMRALYRANVPRVRVGKNLFYSTETFQVKPPVRSTKRERPAAWLLDGAGEPRSGRRREG